MTFLPRAQVLTMEELALIGSVFIELGIKRIRLTGGEPLVRNNFIYLAQQLGQQPDLDELTLTTNGSRLAQYADELKQAGVKRINISLDSLQPERFTELTRIGKLADVLSGIEHAREAGFQRIKLNSVILKGRNEDEVLPLLEFALDKGLDISFIEEMPLGQVTEHDRAAVFCSSQELREMIAKRYTLTPSEERTGGPSRYWRVAGNANRVGFISPHSENFCSSCNRVRLTAEGRLLLCLGNEDSVDLRAIVRAHPGDTQRLKQSIIDAMQIKPERHYFELDDSPQILRFMNATGG